MAGMAYTEETGYYRLESVIVMPHPPIENFDLVRSFKNPRRTLKGRSEQPHLG